jgi:hypothetical protein
MTETQTKTAFDVIDEEVSSWPGVTAGTGSRGEYGFRLGKREIGHLHGSRVSHFGFPKRVWHELFAAGRITYHPVFPGRPGFAARAIESDEDVDDVIALMRLNYDRGVTKHGLPT